MLYKKLDSVSASVVSDLQALLAQLASVPRIFVDGDMERMLAQPGYYCIIACDGERIIGTASIGIIEMPMGKKAIIEDVVVLDAYRGQGIGKELTLKLIEVAKKEGVLYIDLTSNPSREAANALYQKLGFDKRETNVYRLTL